MLKLSVILQIFSNFHKNFTLYSYYILLKLRNGYHKMTAINFPMLILFVTITSYIYGNSFELCGAQLQELRSNRNFLGTFITT